MSAFICQEKLFNNIYSGLLKWKDKIAHYTSHSNFCSIVDLSDDRIEDFVKSLYENNCIAVALRYNEKIRTNPLPRLVRTHDLSVCQFLKDLTCLHYQLCEGSIPQQDIYKKLEDLIRAVQKLIIQDLPEYKKATWAGR